MIVDGCTAAMQQEYERLRAELFPPGLVEAVGACVLPVSERDIFEQDTMLEGAIDNIALRCAAREQRGGEDGETDNGEDEFFRHEAPPYSNHAGPNRKT